jgi:two-component system cell cycle sensor histidine kinase/response regulator CckA
MRSTPVLVALLYVISSGLWVVASSELVLFELREPAAITRWEVGKGLIFIAASGALIYWITKRLVGRLLQSRESLRNSDAQVKLLEDQLMQSQKLEALGRLTRGIAHDFNNVINVIVTSTHLLGSEIDTAPGQARLGAIIHASEQAAALTRQLLSFSRRRTVDLKPLNLNIIVQQTSAVLQRLLDPEIELRLSLEPQLWNVMADADQMTQVVMNLCLNARDAMPRGGTIAIQTRNVPTRDEINPSLSDNQLGSRVLLTVEDSGSGISPAVRDHMFEPFFTTKDPVVGTGLGLSVVSDIVKRSDGFIDVISEPGKGSTFHIYLPRTGTNSS